MNTSNPTTTYQQVSTFDRLMETYEQNYILMRRLFGELRQLEKGDECPWNASVTSKIVTKNKFTLDIQFTDQSVIGKSKQPLRLKVRIYHDARTAELLDSVHREQCLENQASQCTHQQYKRNHMLKKWLTKQIETLS